MNLNHKFKHLHIGIPDIILRLKKAGDFKKAIELIDIKLKKEDLPKSMYDSLFVQRQIMKRLPENYPYTREEAIGKIQEYISDFTEKEFDERVLNEEIDWIYIRGIPRYFNRFYETMIRTDPDFATRAGEKNVISDGSSIGSDGKEDPLNCIVEDIQKNGSVSNRITVRASVQIKDEHFQPGEVVRVHLPIPCNCLQQSQINIEKIEPYDGEIAPEDAPQRTIYWERQMKENQPFIVEYSYIYTSKYHDIHSIIPDNKQPSFHTHEQPPHIMFTPYIQELAESLTKGLDSSLEKARAIYDFITLNVKYSFMRSYFCLENIPEKGALNLKGDCGVMALMFITMCRYVGIPARWQSGLITRPDFCGAHDWAMFYIAPYGWLYADPSFGAGAVREENEKKRQFYFGNLDSFRMVANNEFQHDFTNTKRFWRADPYDNQVGEIETLNRGLRYHEFDSYKKVIKYKKL
ncbi:MAG TPA: transglutaminase-like domain-containing protein [Tissierellaceae bacterium]|nr:transglutaminase-like domain-containing protein [Tissierellaceae bacterium]